MPGKADEYLVVGGGAAGLGVAYQLARQGRRVRLLEARTIGSGAMGASGGMLSPAFEAEYEEIPLLHAMTESRRRYEAWAQELGDIGYDSCGTYEVALLPEDIPYVRRRAEFAQAQGTRIEWLEGPALRRHLPMISPRIAAGSYAPEEGQVDPLLLIHRLKEACERLGVHIETHRPVLACRTDRGYPTVDTPQGPLSAETILVCVGVPLQGLSLPFEVYPVRGQMVSIEPPRPGWLPAPVRYFNRQYGYGYAIPKRDRILLGGTAEEKGLDPSLTVGGILEILRRAYHVFPDLYEARILSTWAGLRPATRTRTPLIAEEALPNGRILYINGLYRNGILLLPFFSEATAAYLLHNQLHPLLQPFYKNLNESTPPTD